MLHDEEVWCSAAAQQLPGHSLQMWLLPVCGAEGCAFLFLCAGDSTQEQQELTEELPELKGAAWVKLQSDCNSASQS